MPPFSSEPGSYRKNKEGEVDLPAFSFEAPSTAGYREKKTGDVLSDEKRREYSVLESSQGVDIRELAENYLKVVYREPIQEIRENEESSLDPVYAVDPKSVGLYEVIKGLETPARVSLARYIIDRLLKELYQSVGKYPRVYSDLMNQFREGDRNNYSVISVMKEILTQGGVESDRVKEVAHQAFRDLQQTDFSGYLKISTETLNDLLIASLVYTLSIQGQEKA